MNSKKEIITEVEKYYSDKIIKHGPSAKGVDWNSEQTQNLRFQQLLKVIYTRNIKVLDYGCGYGALLRFMQNTYSELNYTGFDISSEMLKAAQELFPSSTNVNWVNRLSTPLYDYSIASGIFNVKMELNKLAWEKYIKETLEDMNRISTKGFSFNMLTKYSDEPFMKDYLYYADPCVYFDFCKRNFSKNVALLHDYELFEYTIIVKK